MVKSLIRSKVCDIMIIAICDDYAAVAQELKSNIESICAKKRLAAENHCLYITRRDPASRPIQNAGRFSGH